MAEFPDFGVHCAQETCNQLDYLPVRCDMCSKSFCSAHSSYEEHNCLKSRVKDIRVPTCPKCSKPVPTAKNEKFEDRLKKHLDNNCVEIKTKIFHSYCGVEKCRRKELLPITCTMCKNQFCLAHRHTESHDCKAKEDTRKFIRKGPFLVPRATVKAC
uniref:AN1-type zinc finger protein 2A n=1 Tax=Steinernema glaseri TaxID=37863 RepID=A0A1I7YC78_9BILA